MPKIGQVLKLDRVGIGRRSTVNTDSIEHAMALGLFAPPQAGGEVIAPEGTIHLWEVISPDEDDNYPPIGGGWAFTTVTVEQDSTWIFRGRGHRHVYINDEPRVGDLYNLGITSIPIRLHKGENTFLFKSGRGSLALAFTPPPADVFIETRDPTVPDYIRADRSLVNVGIIITNATDQWQSGYQVRTVSADSSIRNEVRTAVPMLPPYSTKKIPVQLPPCPSTDNETTSVSLQLLKNDTALNDPIEFTLKIRNSNQKHSRTFISSIDGSVQYFGVTPPPDATLESPAEPHALLLTLHGASVQGRGQSNAYASKEGMYIVAPTNRRPFGFDWEDWGRLDAIEVLYFAFKLFNADPAQTYLSGHSMGGHGTWSIGAYHAGRFAAIAPIAGWRDFWSYGGGGEFDTSSEVGRLLDRAANASRTLLMKDNYSDLGVYILHGDADDNVPPSQARFMRDLLANSHDNFAYYEAPGAGHWWGNKCVDWPPIFSMFGHSRINPKPHHVDFTTVDPAISSTRAWVTIQQQVIAREPSRVIAEYDAENHTVRIQPSNTAALSLDLTLFVSDDHPGLPDVRIAKQVMDSAGASFTRIDSGQWSTAEINPAHKSPARGGPFKDAFRNNMLAVVGTTGTPEENAWALAKARYDAETFWYRGNGSIDIIRDTDFDPANEPDRSIILYGNASSNASWQPLLATSPIQISSGHSSLDALTTDRNDLAVLMARPRPNSETAMIAVIGGSGITGMRLTNQFPYFTSGVHYPDWFIAEPDIYLKADAGVLAAGFFELDWSLGKSSVIGIPE
ncbi:MAG: prolyl oligopeptidase family serine peptidase [Phycisphaerales bacterium]|nr:prolyl oligopeptidase family serine peptidase [Phycisphaerales bacterium]